MQTGGQPAKSTLVLQGNGKQIFIDSSPYLSHPQIPWFLQVNIGVTI